MVVIKEESTWFLDNILLISSLNMEIDGKRKAVENLGSATPTKRLKDSHPPSSPVEEKPEPILTPYAEKVSSTSNTLIIEAYLRACVLIVSRYPTSSLRSSKSAMAPSSFGW